MHRILSRFKKRPVTTLFVFSTICSLVLFVSEGRAFSGVGKEACEKCHTLTNDEVNGILQKKLKVADAKILKTRMSPVKGLWEIAFESKGQRGVLYIDFSKKHLIQGAVLDVDAGVNRTQERLTELNKDRRINPASVPVKDALVLGSNSAEKKIVVFTDPD